MSTSGREIGASDTMKTSRRKKANQAFDEGASLSSALDLLTRRQLRNIRKQTRKEDGSVDLLQVVQQRERRFRRQVGVVVEYSDGWYLRYYKDNEVGHRVRVSERLCDPETEKYEREQLRKRRMKAINGETRYEVEVAQGEVEGKGLTIGAFWTSIYEPNIKERLRWSSHHSYKAVWRKYLERPLGKERLRDYRAVHGSRLLTQLAARLNRNTLANVRSLASGMFSHAAALGFIEQNPWRDAKVLVKVRAPKSRIAYTRQETKAILEAIPTIKAQLFFSLCACLGMRPEEAAALRFEDFSAGQVNVVRAAPYGVIGELKNEQSKRTLLLTEPTKGFFEKWRGECNGQTAGYLFTNKTGKRQGDVVNSNVFANLHIRPSALKVCKRFVGCYAGRHGVATELFSLTGDPRAANQVLGNGLPMVMKTYIKPRTQDGAAGQRMLEAADKDEQS
jgi:integrase